MQLSKINITGRIVYTGTAGPAEPYWISTVTATTATAFRGVDLDSEGNIFTVGYTSDYGTQDPILFRYDQTGSVVFQRYLSGANQTDFATKVAVSTDGYVHVGSSIDSTADSSNDFLYTKHDPASGVVMLRRALGDTSNTTSVRDITTDASGNVYMCGIDNSSANQSLIVKYIPSTGTPAWKYATGGTTTSEQAYGIRLDSSGYIYVVGQSGTNAWLAKYNTNGASTVWQRTLGTAGTTETGLSIHIDANDNIYITGSTTSGSPPSLNGFVAKYDTSGTLQWQRVTGWAGVGASDSMTGVDSDEAGNIYVCGYSNPNGVTGSYEMLIHKYNASGVLQFQRTLKSYFDVANEIRYQNGNIYIAGQSYLSASTPYYKSVMVKLPADGSLTGIYGDFAYVASDRVDEAGTMTSSSVTIATTASLRTAYIPTWTYSTSTLPVTDTVIQA